MKKNDERGFLLAEAIVVGVFVLSLFTFLFVNIIPLVGRYEEIDNYDTVDGVYKANLIRAMIMESEGINNVLDISGKSYKRYSANTLCPILVDEVNYCKKLLSDTFLDVKYIYITGYRTSNVKETVKNNTNADFDRATRDYIDNLDSFKQPSGTTYDRYHRLIISFNDGSFANIEVKIS